VNEQYIDSIMRGATIKDNTFYLLYSKVTYSKDVYHHEAFSINSQN